MALETEFGVFACYPRSWCYPFVACSRVQWRQNKVASARRELIAQENARAGAEHLRRVIFNDGVITEKRRGCRTGRGGERDIACDYRRTKANRCRWSAGVEDQRPTDRPPVLIPTRHRPPSAPDICPSADICFPPVRDMGLESWC